MIKKERKLISVFEIMLLTFSIFAFAVVLNSEGVGAEGEYRYYKQTDDRGTILYRIDSQKNVEWNYGNEVWEHHSTSAEKIQSEYPEFYFEICEEECDVVLKNLIRTRHPTTPPATPTPAQEVPLDNSYETTTPGTLESIYPSGASPPAAQGPPSSGAVGELSTAQAAGTTALTKITASDWQPYTGANALQSIGGKEVTLVRQTEIGGKTYFYGNDEGLYTYKPDGTGGFTNELIRATGVSSETLTNAQVGKVNTPLGNVPLGLGTALNGILSGATWALSVYGVGQLVGSILGLDQGVTDAISGGLAAATFVWKAGYETGLLQAEGSGFLGTGISTLGVVGGLAVGLLVAQYLYSEESKEVINFNCQPWEAPVGGKSCEKCNTELYPCSEYRCKALGQACEIVNPGTREERCVWINPKDVNSPIIQPLQDALTKDHTYQPNNAIRPPDRGVKIIYSKSSDGCVKAFTPLEFGVMLNEPSQCKIDYNRTDRFDEMAYYLGDNFYRYNHTEKLSLPGPTQLEKNAPELKNDGTYNLYVRCKDKNGNENNDLFVFTFCVEKGPDVTPPVIVSTSITNGMPFQYGLNSTEIEVYVNEPSDCKWSKSDIDYNEMENNMACSRNIWNMNNQQVYTCKTKLGGLQDRTDNVFFFKCRDQPYLTAEESSDRNTNLESYRFVLKGSQPLTITSTGPNGTIYGNSNVVPVYLQVETDAGENYGDAFCSYSITQQEKDYIQMYETASNKHKQRLDLSSGSYTYYIQCVDLGGNAATSSVNFNVEIDTQAPVVARVYKDGSKLKIITNEDSTCAYSNNQEKACNFGISEGANMPYTNSTEHFAEWTNKIFYIKCQDVNGRQPLPDECSIIVNPKN